MKQYGKYSKDGRQNFVFPMEAMYLTQGSYYYTYSHNESYAMDFDGWTTESGFINECPIYAPFDCTCVAIWGSSSPMVVWQSDNEVNFADGTYGYACIGFVHDNNSLSFSKGDKRKQGDLIAHTGSMGATNDHIHIEAKKGTYEGYHKNNSNVYMMTNSTWLYDLIGIDDTYIKNKKYTNHNGETIDYDFKIIGGSPEPTPTTKKKKYNFILFNRRKR